MDNQQIEEIKNKYVKNIEELTQAKQPDFRKKLDECKDLEELKEFAKEDREYWKKEGRDWDHDFYFDMANCVPNELLS